MNLQVNDLIPIVVNGRVYFGTGEPTLFMESLHSSSLRQGYGCTHFETTWTEPDPVKRKLEFRDACGNVDGSF